MKNKRTIATVALTISTLAGLAAGISAHPGGLDKNGGHRNRKTGEYHYHRSTASSQAAQKPSAVAPKDAGKLVATELLQDWATATAGQKVDALIAVLEAKGILTRAEIVEALQASGSAR